MTSNRYVCIHGHFYQPPRENPSLEAIELQDSAYPYHDWNERICAECYAPNTTSRIRDDQQRIVELVNNYSQISFNFGPTLLSWLEEKAPKVYTAIQSADKLSQGKFGGHGSAIAQVYNHMILPLANHRDKVTQVKWGIADFRHRFGRTPEGMWLAETATNIETLEVLAEQGIRFTILAPRQAKRVRRRGSRKWIDVTGDRIDPSRPYTVVLPSRKTISVFFYDGPISQGVAFEGLLDDGQRFADRLLSGLSDARTWPQLAHIATDGESYGHHHHYGEMALTYALRYIESNKLAELTNYGQFLEMFPPDHIVEIVEDSSWSCIHGIERWRSNCGCNAGGHGDWNQLWRQPLRLAFDWLRDSLGPLYQEQAATLLKDPWKARDAYIDLVLNRSSESMAAFFETHAIRRLSEEDHVRALKLLEMQRHAMLMYTSCGWFFDDLSGLETVQVIHYASRALRLAQESTGRDLEAQFLAHLKQAKSNLDQHGDGANIYDKWVRPSYVGIERLAGHFAISSLFENYEDKSRVYCYHVERHHFSIEADGRLRLGLGRARFSSAITCEAHSFNFGAVYLGEHNIIAGVLPTNRGQDDEVLRQHLLEVFSRADTTEIIRAFDEHFEKRTFSLRSLFRDEQRKVVNLILAESLASSAAAYRSVYESQAPLIRFLGDLAIPVPPALKVSSEIALNHQLRTAFERPELDATAIRASFKEAAAGHVELDYATLEFAIRKRLEKEAQQFAEHLHSVEDAHKFRLFVDLIVSLPFPIAMWEAQNSLYVPLTEALKQPLAQAVNGNGNPDAEALREELIQLSDQLKILIPSAAHV
jgi:alpha-amylase/alpha-mannosidase (GH57 family)